MSLKLKQKRPRIDEKWFMSELGELQLEFHLCVAPPALDEKIAHCDITSVVSRGVPGPEKR